MAKIPMSAKLTIEWSYEADTEDYGTDVPIEMARIDSQNYLEEPLLYAEGSLEVEVRAQDAIVREKGEFREPR